MSPLDFAVLAMLQRRESRPVMIERGSAHSILLGYKHEWTDNLNNLSVTQSTRGGLGNPIIE
jgi:hypothetical protein